MLLRARSVLEHLMRLAVAYVVLLVALILTFLAYQYVHQNVEASRRVQFNETVLETREFIDSRVDSYVSAMLGARGLFYASDAVEAEEWGGYADGIELDRYEGMQVLGYARRVEPDERSEFDEELSQEYGEVSRPDLTLRPEGERPVYFPTTYVEPLDDVNRRLLGQDAYSDPDRRAAMDRARDTGEPQGTSKVYLLSEAPSGSKADLALQPGFVVYVPIYREGEPAGAIEERRDALDGFVVGALEAEGLFRDIFDEQSGSSTDFEIYDGERPTPNNLLYDDDQVLRAGQAREPAGFLGAIGEAIGLPVDRPGRTPEFSRFDDLDLAGRGWSLYSEALPGTEGIGAASQLPLFVLLSGLAVSFLLFGVTFMLIRSRVRAEGAGQDVEDANRELEATNRELEAFSYSVSHDLRAPLRSIDGFSQILLEDYAGELDDEGRDYLGRVRAASQKMGHLIDDLLGLSRVSRGTMNRERVDLSSLAEEVAGSFKEERKAVRFLAQRGLKTWGDSRLLRVALENLIGNAWKFTANEPEPRVQFGVDEELSRGGRVPVYYVRDNGAGFEMAYADKLFGAFQRLHGPEEFEGTGIGLATVQRVVHRHGGRIWARGELGRGATFYFTLRPGLQLDPPRK